MFHLFLIPNTIAQGMRVEWAKSKAHADRWQEEITLLSEEMHRVLWYFGWKTSWWKAHRDRRPQTASDIHNGLAVYTEKQAAIVHGLAKSFALKWYPTLVANGLSTDWPLDILLIQNRQPVQA